MKNGITIACNGAGGRVGFEINASRAGPLMRNVIWQRDLKHVYHLPKGKTWDAELLAAALQKRGVKATRDGDRIALTLPVERLDIDRIVNAKTLDELTPENVGFVSATILFEPSVILENIVFEYARNFEGDCYPQIADVTKAIVDCGYDTGNDRELANRYYAGEIDLNPIFDKIETLQIDKENAVAEYRFDVAKTILEKQRPLKHQIEDLLRAFMRDN